MSRVRSASDLQRSRAVSPEIDMGEFCRATDRLVIQMAAPKLGGPLIAAICSHQALLALVESEMLQTQLWLGSAFLAMTGSRLLWQRISQQRWRDEGGSVEYSIQPTHDGRLELCQGSKARLSTTGRLDPSSKHEARNGDMLERRPDDVGRWFSQWGYYTRSIRRTLIGVAAPATLYLPAPPYVRMPDARERRPVGIVRGCDVIALKGPIHGTNRGKRTVAQLLAQDDFNRWLLLDEVAVRSLADETWGRAPGQQSQIKEKAAFLAAWRIVHERGHEVCLLDLTRAIRDEVSKLVPGPLGLNGGESDSWIALLVRGKYAPIMRRLSLAEAVLSGRSGPQLRLI